MSNRTDAQDGIDFQKNKQGIPDSISPTNQAEKTLQPILNGAVMSDELPYTVTPELVTFDRDIQVPQNSINIGDAIKMSDLAQSIGYETAFDEKQYILMGYEITANESKRPTVKAFDAPSSFVLQPLDSETESFTSTLVIPIPAVQQVIGKTYKLKAVCDQVLLVEVFRLADNGGLDTKIINEELPASQTNINGFDFDLIPLVDFELGKNYRIELTPLNGGTLEIKGGTISGSFVPYIERVLGWEYTNKAVAYEDEGLGGLYPIFIDTDAQLNLEDRFIICQPAFPPSDINMALPEIQAATNEKYFVEVYNASENDDYSVNIKDNAGIDIASMEPKDRLLFFPVGSAWESIVLSTQVFTDDTITGAGSYTDPLSVSKLYAHKGVTVDAPFTTSSNVAQLVDTWTLNVSEEALYNVVVTVEWKLNANNQDAVFRFDLNGVTGIEINQEPKDVTNNVFLTTFAFDTLQAGQNTVEFYARKEQGNANVLTINSNRYTAQKIDVLS